MYFSCRFHSVLVAIVGLPVAEAGKPYEFKQRTMGSKRLRSAGMHGAETIAFGGAIAAGMRHFGTFGSSRKDDGDDGEDSAWWEDDDWLDDLWDEDANWDDWTWDEDAFWANWTWGDGDDGLDDNWDIDWLWNATSEDCEAAKSDITTLVEEKCN